MVRNIVSYVGPLLVGLLLAGVGAAQPAKKEKKLPFPIKWEFRLRSELRDNFDLNAALDDQASPVLERFRISIAPRWKSALLFAQIQDSRAWFKDQTTYSSAAFHPYQLYFEVPVGDGFRLRTGRQELMVGEERLLGAFGWDNRGRAFDAVSLYREKNGSSFRVFAANLASPGDKGVSRGQNLFGMSRKQGRGERVFETYAFWLHDQTLLQGEKETGRTRVFTSGVRLTQKHGSWNHNLETAWQAGKRNGDSHLAAAFTYRCDHVWSSRRPPSLGLEYNLATGDGDSRDGKSREFHNLYPTNHPFYGYMDLFGWRNIHNPRIVFGLKTSSRSRFEANYHEFWLARPSGGWKAAGGRILARDPLGRSGRRVGGEVDLLANYSVSSHWKFLLGYSTFFPGAFARATRDGAGVSFGYFQLTFDY